jgi:hypothetical protein
VDYTYVLEKEIDIEVEGYGIGSDQTQIIARNQVCCSSKVKGSSDPATYAWAAGEEECRSLGYDNAELITSVVSVFSVAMFWVGIAPGRSRLPASHGTSTSMYIARRSRSVISTLDYIHRQAAT